MLPEQDKHQIVTRYTERFQLFGRDIRTLNPGAEQKYRLQHSVHASVDNLEGKTILDIGCGLAHYYEYLLAIGRQVKYIGYDIVPSFIDANRQRFPEAQFELRDILRDGIGHNADYVVMCQVFNNRFAGIENDRIVRQAIAIGFEAAGLGLSIDMLTDDVNYKEQHLYYFSSSEMFQYAKTLTRFACLRHEYLPFHFTLCLYKKAKMSC